MKRKYNPVRRLRIGDENFQWIKDETKKLDLSVDELFSLWKEKIVGQNCRTKNKEIVQVEKVHTQPIMKAFHEINPTLNFANKTQRQACEDLVKQFGEERVLKVIGFVGQVRGVPFCPVITTPMQLRDKWSALEIFALAEKNKQSSKTLTTYNPNL